MEEKYKQNNLKEHLKHILDEFVSESMHYEKLLNENDMLISLCEKELDFISSKSYMLDEIVVQMSGNAVTTQTINNIAECSKNVTITPIITNNFSEKQDPVFNLEEKVVNNVTLMKNTAQPSENFETNKNTTFKNFTIIIKGQIEIDLHETNEIFCANKSIVKSFSNDNKPDSFASKIKYENLEVTFDNDKTVIENMNSDNNILNKENMLQENENYKLTDSKPLIRNNVNSEDGDTDIDQDNTLVPKEVISENNVTNNLSDVNSVNKSIDSDFNATIINKISDDMQVVNKGDLDILEVEISNYKKIVQDDILENVNNTTKLQPSNENNDNTKISDESIKNVNENRSSDVKFISIIPEQYENLKITVKNDIDRNEEKPANVDEKTHEPVFVHSWTWAD